MTTEVVRFEDLSELHKKAWSIRELFLAFAFKIKTEAKGRRNSQCQNWIGEIFGGIDFSLEEYLGGDLSAVRAVIDHVSKSPDFLQTDNQKYRFIIAFVDQFSRCAGVDHNVFSFVSGMARVQADEKELNVTHVLETLFYNDGDMQYLSNAMSPEAFEFIWGWYIFNEMIPELLPGEEVPNLSRVIRNQEPRPEPPAIPFEPEARSVPVLKPIDPAQQRYDRLVKYWAKTSGGSADQDPHLDYLADYYLPTRCWENITSEQIRLWILTGEDQGGIEKLLSKEGC